ncbi:exocyst complex component 3 isoform X2 [Ictalurus furcatus]|nr:exocyst complex component 3 isoform X2 [Ictalurus furcatus]
MKRSFKTLFKKKCQDRQEERLVSSEPSGAADEDPRQQTDCLMNTTDQFGADTQMSPQDTILSIFIDTLAGDIYLQELKATAEQVKQCDIIPDGNEGSDSYSQCRLKDYLTAVEMFVHNNFPALPTNSQPYTGEYLNDAMSFICNKVTGLVPVLEDSRLVNYLLDSYNRRLFSMLRLLMDRSSSVKDSLFLLQWVKNTYFRQGHKACLITQNCVLSVSDPLLLADWLEYSKQKLLTLLQENISTTLHSILQHDEPNGVCCDDSSEEAFIQVQLDVIQLLNAHIQASKTVSHTLKTAVQRLCCDELHSFIQRYVSAQRANKANLLRHFRTIYTCRQLRSYALSIIDSNNNTDSSTLLMLENMETQSLFSAQQLFANIAKDNLKKYFTKEDGHLNNMMIISQKMLATLPHMEQGEETKELIVKAAYHSVTRAYLQCLMQRKYKKLEKRWKDVGKKIMCDAELFHSKFAKQNGSDDEQKIVLLKMGEILQCRHVDTLKLICSELYIAFPEESEEYIPALLYWRGALSRRQIKKIIHVSRDVEDHVRNGDHLRPHPHVYCCCCLC